MDEKNDHDYRKKILEIYFEFIDKVAELSYLEKEMGHYELFEKCISDIKGQKDKFIEGLKENNNFDSVGLSGDHLYYKYKRLMCAYEKWLKDIFDKEIRHKFFKWLNTILGSLSRINPIFDMLKEFKDGIEAEDDVIFQKSNNH